MADENEEVGTSKSRMRILSHEIRNRKVYCGDLLTRLAEWMEDEDGILNDDICASLTAWILKERKILADLDGGAA